VRREVIELRPSASNPTHGIVRTRVTVRNQDGKAVMSLVSAGRVPTRPTQAGTAA
jgi:acyl dehydratase